MKGWVNPGPECKQQLAHSSYANACIQRDLNPDLEIVSQACQPLGYCVTLVEKSSNQALTHGSWCKHTQEVPLRTLFKERFTNARFDQLIDNWCYVTTGKRQCQLSLLSLQGRKIEYRTVCLGLRRGVFTCDGWQLTYSVIPYDKWHSVAVRWSSINSYTRPFNLFHISRSCITIRSLYEYWCHMIGWDRAQSRNTKYN